MQSYRRKCRKFRFVNSVPAEQGARTAAGVFAPNGRHLFLHRLTGAHELRQRVRPIRAESFSLNLSGGIRRLRTAGTCGTRRGGKKGRHLRFLPSLNTRFPCGVAWVQMVDCVSVEKGNGRGFLLQCLSQPVRSVRYITATQTGKSSQAQHDRVAQFVSTLL